MTNGILSDEEKAAFDSDRHGLDDLAVTRKERKARKKEKKSQYRPREDVKLIDDATLPEIDWSKVGDSLGKGIAAIGKFFGDVKKGFGNILAQRRTGGRKHGSWITYGDLYDYLLKSCKFDDVPNGIRSVDCDNTLKLSEHFCQKHHLDWDRIEKRLNKYGGYCDCEVLFNVMGKIQRREKLVTKK